jgi:outer membrane protein OmpA-like peptidoglycan-associated protein
MRSIKYLLLLLIFTPDSKLYSQSESDCSGYSKFSKHAKLAEKAILSNDLAMAKVYLGALRRKNKGQSLNSLFLQSEVDLMEGELKAAIKKYEEICRLCPSYPRNILFKWGSVLEELGFLKESKLKYEEYLNQNGIELSYKNVVNEKLELWRFRDSLIDNPINFKPQRINALSSDADEFLGILTPDESKWFFTRRFKYLDFKLGPAPVRRLKEDFCQLVNKENAQYQSLTYPFNQGFNEGGPSLTADNSTMALTSCESLKPNSLNNGYRNCDIFLVNRYEDQQWSDFYPIDLINEKDSWEAQPAISANGDRIIFSSDRDGGFGGLDLYSIEMDSLGNWHNLKNLGSRINTFGDEKSPFFHADNEHLFFSSNGHLGIGDFDVFVVNIHGNEDPLNLGYPINTEKAEVGFAVSAKRPMAYFSSNNQIGNLTSSSNYDFFEFTLPEKLFPDSVSFIQGKVKGAQKFNQNLQIRIENLKSNRISRIKVNKQTGEYTAVLNAQETADYLISVEGNNTGYTSARFQLKKNQISESIPMLEVKSLKSGEIFDLYSVFFESNSFALSKLDQLALRDFAKFLNKNPSLNIEIQGHTDNIGSSSKNMKLSENRAKSVHDFLISIGVSSIQMTYRGYGDNLPMESNQKGWGRSRNRRTTFKVLNTELN